jgi:transcriptional regulator with XRE-family HTH domain
MEKIKQLRDKYNLSRKDLADVLGKKIKFIVELEKGSETLSSDDVKRLCNEYGLEKNFFVSNRESSNVMQDFDEIIGRNVKYFRELNGMTQQILAEELGYAGPASISGVERGIKPMGKKALLRLADLFGIHVSELFNPFDPTLVNSKNQLIGQFHFIMNHSEVPSNWDDLSKAIHAAHRELTGVQS